jgi:FixJ family two-component response regulator
MIKEASQYTIAVVDDDLRVRESLESLLESEGLNVRLFSSAEDYIDAAVPKSACDCIISDVRMPGMDGTGLQRHINAQYPDLPVILITAHHDDEVSKRAIRAGAFCCLYKPLDTDALLEVIEAAVNPPSNPTKVKRDFNKERPGICRQ